MVRVRPATLEDAAAILEIYRPIIEETVISFEFVVPTLDEMRERIAGILEGYPYFVAEDDAGEVVGYVYATRWRARKAYDGTCEAALYIREGQRGRGVGRRLMEELMPELARRGFHQVIAGSSMPNPASQAILESFGFEHVGTFPRVGRKFDRWVDVGFWQRPV